MTGPPFDYEPDRRREAGALFFLGGILSAMAGLLAGAWALVCIAGGPEGRAGSGAYTAGAIFVCVGLVLVGVSACGFRAARVRLRRERRGFAVGPRR